MSLYLLGFWSGRPPRLPHDDARGALVLTPTVTIYLALRTHGAHPAARLSSAKSRELQRFLARSNDHLDNFVVSRILSDGIVIAPGPVQTSATTSQEEPACPRTPTFGSF